jgi:hypothetical protein
MSETVKQEGDFKLKSKPKKLVPTKDEPIKVNLAEPKAAEEEVTKVVIKNEDKDAVQEQSPEGSVLRSSEPNEKTGQETNLELSAVGEGNEEPVENVIQEITEEKVEKIEQEVKEAVQNKEVSGKPLPENIEKLVSFMEETGGTIEDYARLNTDYSNVDNNTLLKEYYSKTKPHLDSEDISILMEDFFYDEELDEPKEIRKKKIAFKEEVAKAKNFLEETKKKYYDEIKLRPGVTQDQQKAMDFFNRYNEGQKKAAENYESFKQKTENLFSEEFEGFEFNLGEKKFRYNVSNPKEVASIQSDINNIVGKFLAEDGSVVDEKGYHKAMFAAYNADKIASHFYEQGKADAVKDVVSKSKNPSINTAREAPKDVFIGGLKVRAISGTDSSKLKIKTKKFN